MFSLLHGTGGTNQPLYPHFRDCLDDEESEGEEDLPYDTEVAKYSLFQKVCFVCHSLANELE